MFKIPMPSKTYKTTCHDDVRAFVETNRDTKSFRAVVENVQFFQVPQGINLNGIKINHKEKIVSIDLTVADSKDEAKEQAKNLLILLSKLNDYSNLNQFYLSRTEFFNRQFDYFATSIFGSSLQSKKESPASHDKPHDHSMAF